MSDPTCVRCERPTADGYACVHCANRAAEQLAQVADMCPAARDVAHRLSATVSGSGGSGKPGSTLPLDLGATARLDAVEGNMGTWARATAEERIGHALKHVGSDPIVHAVRYLTANLEWWRHRPAVDEFLRDVEACARVVAGIARGPRERKYLGPCGAPTLCDVSGFGEAPGTTLIGGAPCEGYVYGPAGGSTGTCRACGARVDQAERRAWLDDQVADRMADTPMRAADIGHAIRVSADTIRTWAQRDKLSSYWWDGERFVPWVEPREGEDVKARGHRLHYVADVMELSRRAAERRAENAARRDRRDTQESAA